ncbi:Hypothetical_protein [Hexamita inflata]|uniref:Hypothetical_protein n=1 Tax=Hexamita inflata TaxID=28002 RepID=A0AA86QR97_9EUKA|nr:Hypothetical protein HINF_LOCUS49227 [Hexamita inflata]
MYKSPSKEKPPVNRIQDIRNKLQSLEKATRDSLRRFDNAVRDIWLEKNAVVFLLIIGQKGQMITAMHQRQPTHQVKQANTTNQVQLHYKSRMISSRENMNQEEQNKHYNYDIKYSLNKQIGI